MTDIAVMASEPILKQISPSTSTTKSVISEGRVLCQKVTKTFDKTAHGRIFEEELKDIFSLLILQLDLKPSPTNKKLFSAKTFPFTFSVEKALDLLSDLDFDATTSTTVVNLKYKLHHSIGVMALMKFYDAKLLHCPSDRTMSRLKPGLILQPTPKGISIVSKFIYKHGIKFVTPPELLLSTLNSTDIFCFERNYLNDKVVCSDHLTSILFARMFGSNPNVWSSDKKPETFKIKLDLVMLGTENGSANPLPNPSMSILNSLKRDRLYTSPLHHKYFTNPESDAHLQYFVEGTGVRVFRNRVFLLGKDSVTIDYCVSGKSIVQWLMDCTDILSKRVAIEVGNIFISAGYLIPLFHNSSKRAKESKTLFHDSFESFYKISDLGKRKLFWYKKTSKNQDKKLLPSKVNMMDPISKLSSLELKDVLADPGLKHLFKLHLTNEYCFENIDAYDQLHLFLRKVSLLTKLLNYIEMNFNHNSNMYKGQVLKLANDCLMLIYHIYFTYLSPKASFVLNIDYNLRSRFISMMVSQEKDFGSAYDFSSNLQSAMTYGSFADYSPTIETIDDIATTGTAAMGSRIACESHNTSMSTNEASESSASSTATRITAATTTFSGQEATTTFSGQEATTEVPDPKERLSNITIGSQALDPTLNECDSAFSSRFSPSGPGVTFGKDSPPTSPRDKEFKEAYNSLVKFTPVATELTNSLFKLMNIDSFPKFLSSDLFSSYKGVLVD